jgi:hypothetical protein
MTTDPELLNELLVYTDERSGEPRTLAHPLALAADDALTHERDLELIATYGMRSRDGGPPGGSAARGRW